MKYKRHYYISYIMIMILTPTYNYLQYLKIFLDHLLPIIQMRPDTQLVLLDNASDPETRDYLSQLKKERVEVHLLAQNRGKGNAVNDYLATHIHTDNPPEIFISLDPDITFDLNSFDYFIQAVRNIPNLGLLSMRYVKNAFYPEVNLFFPARKITGFNQQSYKIKIPFMANVAGGIVGVPGWVMRKKLNYVMYPHVKTLYYGQDVLLFNAIKKSKLRYGYLEGTMATHYKTNPLKGDQKYQLAPNNP